MEKKQNELRYLVLDALMIAMYIVLNTITEISIGNVKITFGPLPIIFIAFYLGLKHACIVAALGEFLAQIIGYPISWSTVIYTIPPIIRVVCICILIFVLLKRNKVSFDLAKIKYYQYFIIIITSGFITTIMNTFAIELNAIIYGYNSKAFILVDLFFRLLSMIISSVIYTFIIKAVIDSIIKNKIK